MSKENIKDAFLNNYKFLYKEKERISLLEQLKDKSKDETIQEYLLCFEGYIKFLKKENMEAIDCFRSSLKIDDKCLLSLHGLGNVYLALGDYENAILSFKSAIEYDATFSWSLNALGNTYLRLTNYTEAVDYLKKAIESDKNFPYPWYNLGIMHTKLSNYKDAKECFEKSIQIDNKYSFSWVGLGQVYNKEGNYTEAQSCLQKAIDLDPNLYSGWLGMGFVCNMQEKYSEAVPNYEKALQLVQEQCEITETQKSYMVSMIKLMLKNTRDIIKNKQELHKQSIGQSITPIIKILNETINSGIENKALLNKRDFTDFLKEKPVIIKTDNETYKDVYFEVLRRWNSFTPIIADNTQISKGGGYYFSVKGKGVVIDPGFNFVDNFKSIGHLLYEIDVILISHAHNDHTADLESILTLLFKYNSEIKDSEDPNNEVTIRKQIAEQKNIPIENVTLQEIEEVFIKSPRRKIINIYAPLSVIKKYQGLFDLFTKSDYRIHCIECGDNIKIDEETTVNVIGAKHNDIISDFSSVGFVFSFNDLVFIFTGDTGWDNDIEEQYLNIKQNYKDKYIILLAHIGGFKDCEKYYVNPDYDGYKAFYKNHLGRLGLAKLNEITRPRVCFISEFGEELRGNRVLLTKIFQEAFDEGITFLPADIGLKYDLITKKVMAINKIDIGDCSFERGYIDADRVKTIELRNDYSLVYYDKKADFTESDLVQILLYKK